MFLNYQKVSFISVCIALAGALTLLFCWDELTDVKIISIALFTFAILVLILRNNKKKRNYETKVYGKIKPMQLGNERFRGSERLREVQNFLNRVQQEKWKNSSIVYKTNNQYDSNDYFRKFSRQSDSYSPFVSKKDREQSIQIENRVPFHISIPQSTTQVFDKIKSSILPNKYLKDFIQTFQFIREFKSVQYDSISNLSRRKCFVSSFCIVNEPQTNKLSLLLCDGYDVYIKDQIYCAQIISNHFQSKLEKFLDYTKNNIKIVSEMTMKCFGYKVNFFNKGKQIYSSYSNQISLFELRQMLQIVKNNQYLPGKFKPLMSFKDFMKLHFQKLYYVVFKSMKVVESIDNQELMAFQIYIQLLKEQFYDQKIQITRTMSVLSDQMKKIKHAFFVHDSNSQIYFTYNRIKGFKTTNPLVLIMAFFTQIFKMGLHKQSNIIRNVSRFFKEKKLEKK